MSQPFRSNRRPPVRGIDDHDDRYCGHSWESSCRACRKDYWPERYFAMQAEARPFLPRQREPFVSQMQLIKSLHHYRHKAAVREAIIDLVLDELVEIIDARIDSRRIK